MWTPPPMVARHGRADMADVLGDMSKAQGLNDRKVGQPTAVGPMFQHFLFTL